MHIIDNFETLFKNYNVHAFLPAQQKITFVSLAYT